MEPSYEIEDLEEGYKVKAVDIKGNNLASKTVIEVPAFRWGTEMSLEHFLEEAGHRYKDSEVFYLKPAKSEDHQEPRLSYFETVQEREDLSKPVFFESLEDRTHWANGGHYKADNTVVSTAQDWEDLFYSTVSYREDETLTDQVIGILKEEGSIV